MPVRAEQCLLVDLSGDQIVISYEPDDDDDGEDEQGIESVHSLCISSPMLEASQMTGISKAELSGFTLILQYFLLRGRAFQARERCTTEFR